MRTRTHARTHKAHTHTYTHIHTHTRARAHTHTHSLIQSKILLRTVQTNCLYHMHSTFVCLRLCCHACIRVYWWAEGNYAYVWCKNEENKKRMQVVIRCVNIVNMYMSNLFLLSCTCVLPYTYIGFVYFLLWLCTAHCQYFFSKQNVVLLDEERKHLQNGGMVMVETFGRART